MKKLLLFSVIALTYSCGDKYEGKIIYQITIPPSNAVSVYKTDVNIDANSDRKAKIQFVSNATIYNNASQFVYGQFISGKLLKNGKAISYELEQKTIDSINNSIKRLTSHRNGYFNPYIQK